MGEGRREVSLSEMSVAEESALGDVVLFHPVKNELIFWPGVLGGFNDEGESIALISGSEPFLVPRSTWRAGFLMGTVVERCMFPGSG